MTMTNVAKLITAFLAASALMTSASAAFAASPGWTGNSMVVKLVVTSSGGINIRLSPDLSGCVSQSGYGSVWASIYPNHPGLNRMKADLLAAYLSEKPVSLYLIDADCSVGEMVLGGW